MPFDGVVTKCIIEELKETILDGRIEKIFQPERDEIVLNIRAKGQNLKLLLSANSSYPRIHFTGVVKENPAAPPVFCMLLRKHLSGAKIIGVEFSDYERIVTLLVESINELGDMSVKKIIIEIMGRHSNIILVNSDDKIIDSIKHVDSETSSVREVMPARPYILPPSQNKTSPEALDMEKLFDKTDEYSSTSLEKYLLNKIKGFSPLLCREICFRAGVDERTSISTLSVHARERVKSVLHELVSQIASGKFSPCLIFEDGSFEKPLDFHCVEIRQYKNIKHESSINRVLDIFYSKKDLIERIRQKKSVLIKVLQTNIERCNKKLSLQQEKLREVSDREKLRLYGELITANIYNIQKNAKSVKLLNYYSEGNEYIEVPLDENLSPQENAQRYFKKYAKAKSAYKYTSEQLQETLSELEYLEGVLVQLENSDKIQEIEEIKEELIEQGYISSRKKASSKRKNDKTSLPMHFKSSEGIDIYVGKNNRQNDFLTMKQASSKDIWLHARNIPGSHVIIKKQQKNIGENTLLEAAILAAYYSRAKMSSAVPVDYTEVKNVKKPPGAKPGMVIYDNFKTIIVTPDESVVKSLKQQ
ncbi:MAG TPA: fibronectin/fibrinogen-binding protein [Clostridiaceae bacterium]|nr:fibronectin/fibrinogen-binding protein [Clostridiaceae bacterium]